MGYTLLHTNTSLYECPEIINLQTELNYLNLFKIYCIFSDWGVPPWGWGWVGGWGNRIERIGFVL